MFLNELKQMKEQDIEALNIEELQEISRIKIHHQDTNAEKIKSFMKQVNNPYCYRCKEVKVKVVFSDNGGSLEHMLSDFLIQQKNSQGCRQNIKEL